MKTKHLFLSALTCLAFAACSNDDDAVQNPQSENEKKAYLAVQFAMPGAGETRADGMEYATAEEQEYAANDAAFFFFDNSGNAAATPCYIDNASSIWGDVTHTHDGNSDEKESTIVLVVKNPKATLSKVVAILNPSQAVKDLATKKDLSATDDVYGDLDGTVAASGVYLNNNSGTTANDLAKIVETYTTPTVTAVTDGKETINGSFVMSNSVYLDGTTIVNATPVSEYLKNDRQEAINAPLVIHVERVWSKVSVSATGNAELTTMFNNIDTKKDIDGTSLYLNVTGWWLNNTNLSTNLLKQLPSVATEPVWNDESDYRSYWASAYQPTIGTGETFVDYYGHSTYTAGQNNIYAKYCLENTSVEIYKYNNNDVYAQTQVVVAATITDGTYPVDVISYQGLLYTEANFISKVVDYLQKEGYTDGEGNDIDASDLTFVYNTTSNPNVVSQDYLAKVVVNTENLTSIKKGSASVESSTLNTDLSTMFGELKYWKDGQTYFFAKVTHDFSATAKESTPAIIRNHLYKVTVSGLKGLGTPVPNPEIPIIPVIPDEDTESFLACKIAVLKYRVVEQEVTLGGEAGEQ